MIRRSKKNLVTIVLIGIVGIVSTIVYLRFKGTLPVLTREYYAAIEKRAIQQNQKCRQLNTWENLHIVPFKNETTLPKESSNREKKIILLYTGFFGERDWRLGPGDTTIKELNCPVSDCTFSTDLNDYSRSSALVFHAWEVDDEPPEQQRPDNQIWIHFSHESPDLVRQPSDKWKGLFNWSMSYRDDSDVFFPYGQMYAEKAATPTNFTAIAMQKRRLVAWIVSNCDVKSKRKEYVTELQKYIPVDIYGACGTLQCSRAGTVCRDMLGNTYKFFLSFENSFCKEYISEKFYDFANLNLVPIVRGDFDYRKIIPPDMKPHMYINTNLFQSPRQLASYLQYLNDNPKVYVKYLEWKDHYVARTSRPRDMAWCRLCDQLHHLDAVPHRDPVDFFYEDGVCHDPFDI